MSTTENTAAVSTGDSPFVGSVGGQVGFVGEVPLAAGTDERIIVPVVEETLSVGKRTVERGGIRIIKTVDTREEQVPVSLRQETVSFERVPVNEY